MTNGEGARLENIKLEFRKIEKEINKIALLI